MDTTLYFPNRPIEDAEVPKTEAKEQEKQSPQAKIEPPVSPPRPESPFSYGQGVFVIILLIVGFIVTPFLKTSGALPPPKWEYQIFSAEDFEFTSKVNRLGEEGWELVFARRATTGGEYSSRALYEMIFKRQKQP